MTQRMVTLTNSKLKDKEGNAAVQEFVAESVPVWKARGGEEVKSKDEEGVERVPADDSDKPAEKQVAQQPAPSAPKNQS